MPGSTTVDDLEQPDPREPAAYGNGRAMRPAGSRAQARYVNPSLPVHDVLTQHTEGASFLWNVRQLACAWPHYGLTELSKLDLRLEAHLDGLRIAGEEGWRHCVKELSWQQPGEVFAAAALAIKAGHRERLAQIGVVIAKKPALVRGLVSAMGWAPLQESLELARELAGASTPWKQRAGIAAYAIHRQDPGDLLERAVRAENPWLRARALRAAGELGRTDLVWLLERDLDSADPGCSFWAAWSVALLSGYTRAIERLQLLAEHEGPYRAQACDLALRCLPYRQAHAWHKTLSPRLAVSGAGALGDPALLPYLLDQMRAPALARLAGEAFSMITGVDLARERLDAPQPEGFEAGPSEDPAEEDVALDADERLPWPNADLLARWFDAHGGRFLAGERYLLGCPIEVPNLREVLRHGRQRQRAAAALELVLRHRGTPLAEIRAPGFRQREVLE